MRVKRHSYKHRLTGVIVQVASVDIIDGTETLILSTGEKLTMSQFSAQYDFATEDLNAKKSQDSAGWGPSAS